MTAAADANPADARAPRQAPVAVGLVVEPNVAVPMRDGGMLRADVYRPSGKGPYPVLVYRTPYGKDRAAQDYQTHLKAVARGYAVVLQDVRGRYASPGIFDPYRHEGRDGYDTIEWAARQPWSNGAVGTYGLSYPGAVQWLAALEAPPHLRAMVPAMTFSTPRNFFYSNGVFDLSWLDWIEDNISPGARRDLAKRAPYYLEWREHMPEEKWWDWAELRGRYSRVTAAVLNLSGWYDEAYGPEGAATNFNGLVASRAAAGSAKTHLFSGPWVHGVSSTGERRTGDLDFGPAAAIDYDDTVLDFLDHFVKGVENAFSSALPVRYFLMGANEWKEARQWPPAGTTNVPLYFGARDTDSRADRLGTEPPPGAGAAKAGSGARRLSFESPALSGGASVFEADPHHPVTDPYPDFGPHDYSRLMSRKDLLTFETAPLRDDLTVAGMIEAKIYVSCDCPDFDLWVRIQDVYPDGRAMNLMSPGNDVLRASYREFTRDDAGARPRARRLMESGKVELLRLPSLPTSIRFLRGHRLRVQISASFAPHLSRNLQTGESEWRSSESKIAHLSIWHDVERPSHLVLPVSPGYSAAR
jgi:putative CocE/NonD family hydrolase